MEDHIDSPDGRVIQFIRSNFIILALFIIGAILLIYGAVQMYLPREAKIKFEQADSPEAKSAQSIKVDVGGNVINPGVYSLPIDSRIQDALVRAGGLSNKADREYVSRSMNLAQKLTDGQKIYIPTFNEDVSANVSTNVSTQSVIGISSSGQISINTSSESDLDKLPGVGPVTAGKIIDGRPYLSINELVERGILGQAAYEKLKDQVSL